MCFRKDELIVPEESDDEDDENESDICEILVTNFDGNGKISKQIKSIEDTHELTEKIE